MRHRKSGRALNRNTSRGKANTSNMLTSLFEFERIRTTTPRAKELRGMADSMITLGKRGDLHARRRVMRIIKNKDVVHKLFADIAPRNQDRNGGYTRVLKLGNRYGDCAPMSLIELVERDQEES